MSATAVTNFTSPKQVHRILPLVEGAVNLLLLGELIGILALAAAMIWPWGWILAIWVLSRVMR